MLKRVHPGDLVWVGPDTSCYNTPDTFEVVDDIVYSTIDWTLALVIWSRHDGWAFVLHGETLVFVGTRCLMSIAQTPSSVVNR